MTDSLLQEAGGRPDCIAVILCSEIIEDKRTNNKTLVSLFNHIGVTQLPSVHPRMFIMISLADGIGKWRVTLDIFRPSGKELLRTVGEVNFERPDVVLDLAFEFRALPLDEEGVYRIDVLIEDRPTVSRRFTVHRLEAGN